MIILISLWLRKNHWKPINIISLDEKFILLPRSVHKLWKTIQLLNMFVQVSSIHQHQLRLIASHSTSLKQFHQVEKTQLTYHSHYSIPGLHICIIVIIIMKVHAPSEKQTQFCCSLPEHTETSKVLWLLIAWYNGAPHWILNRWIRSVGKWEYVCMCLCVFVWFGGCLCLLAVYRKANRRVVQQVFRLYIALHSPASFMSCATDKACCGLFSSLRTDLVLLVSDNVHILLHRNKKVIFFFNIGSH